MLICAIEILNIIIINIIIKYYFPFKQGVALYAELNGKVMPVTVSSDDAKYQVRPSVIVANLPNISCRKMHRCLVTKHITSFFSF